MYQTKSKQSGLSVMEIDIPSGYVIMNDTLRALVQSKNPPNLKRAEFYGRKVVFYFDYVSCINKKTLKAIYAWILFKM